jgi:hypothetical protein
MKLFLLVFCNTVHCNFICLPPAFAGWAPHAYLPMLGCSPVTVSSDPVQASLHLMLQDGDWISPLGFSSIIGPKAPGKEEVALALVMTRRYFAFVMQACPPALDIAHNYPCKAVTCSLPPPLLHMSSSLPRAVQQWILWSDVSPSFLELGPICKSFVGCMD